MGFPTLRLGTLHGVFRHWGGPTGGAEGATECLPKTELTRVCRDHARTVIFNAGGNLTATVESAALRAILRG